MDISPEELDTFMRMVQWRLRSFKHYPDYEDILSHGYIGMWRQISRYQPNPRYNLLTSALNGAIWEVKNYLRKIKPIFENEVMSLDAYRDSEDGDAINPCAMLLHDKDFSPDLIESQYVRGLLSSVSEEDAEILWRVHGLQEDYAQIARERGRYKSYIWRRADRAMNKIRAIHQTPL